MKRLILAGGGHVYGAMLRRFRERPADTELVLVRPGPDTPDSGMLPGHVAGFYPRDDIFMLPAPRFAARGVDPQVGPVAFGETWLLEIPLVPMALNSSSTERVDIHLHHALRDELDHLAQQVGVGPPSSELAQCHACLGHRLAEWA